MNHKIPEDNYEAKARASPRGGVLTQGGGRTTSQKTDLNQVAA